MTSHEVVGQLGHAGGEGSLSLGLLLGSGPMPHLRCHRATQGAHGGEAELFCTNEQLSSFMFLPQKPLLLTLPQVLDRLKQYLDGQLRELGFSPTLLPLSHVV